MLSISYKTEKSIMSSNRFTLFSFKVLIISKAILKENPALHTLLTKTCQQPQ